MAVDLAVDLVTRGILLVRLLAVDLAVLVAD